MWHVIHICFFCSSADTISISLRSGYPVLALPKGHIDDRKQSTFRAGPVRSQYACLLHFYDGLISGNGQHNIFSHDPITVDRSNHQRADLFLAVIITPVVSGAGLLHVQCKSRRWIRGSISGAHFRNMSHDPASNPKRHICSDLFFAGGRRLAHTTILNVD